MFQLSVYLEIPSKIYIYNVDGTYCLCSFCLHVYTKCNCCACPKPGLGFPTLYVVVRPSFVLSELRWDVIVRFVDIDGIVDNHSSIFLFMTSRSYIQIGFADHLTFTRRYCWSGDISCSPLTARIKSQMGVQAPITTWRVTISWKVEQRFINLIGISHLLILVSSIT